MRTVLAIAAAVAIGPLCYFVTLAVMAPSETLVCTEASGYWECANGYECMVLRQQEETVGIKGRDGRYWTAHNGDYLRAQVPGWAASRGTKIVSPRQLVEDINSVNSSWLASHHLQAGARPEAGTAPTTGEICQ